MHTKVLILHKATELFNHQGEAATSLRQLASFMGISDGNLRYHYKTKEDLVVAIFQLMLQEMEQILQRNSPESALAAGQITTQFRDLFMIMYRYKFLFIESTLLLKSYASLRKVYLQLVESRRAYFMDFFHQYRQMGLLRNDFDDAYYTMLFEQIFIISDNWIKYVEIQEDDQRQLQQQIDHYVGLCLGILYPVIKDRSVFGMNG